MNGIGYLQALYSTLGAEKDFIRVFREVFAGPPYFEHHTAPYVRNKVWKPHLERGMIVLAYNETELVGFGCAMPLEEVQDTLAPKLLRASGFEGRLKYIWHMSELGVSEKYRGQGIGAALVLNRLLRICERGGTHYSLQTASKGSHSEPLYRKIGALEIGEDEATESRYFVGSCEEAISKLETTQTSRR